MSVTIKDVAKVCGVSFSTVSRALNNHEGISSKTRQKIQKIAQSMGYSPNAMARGLVKKKTNMLGLLIPDIANPYWPEVAKGVEDMANEEGYQILLCNTDLNVGKEILYRETLLEKRVDGLIVAPVTEHSCQAFENLDIPVVFIESRTDSDSSSYVIVDNIKGAFDATEYLIKLGHRDIACIVGKKASITHEERLLGYRQALEKYGIKARDSLIKVSSSLNLNGGYAAAKELLEGRPAPTAVFAFNDMLAMGAILAVEEKSLKVPEDISVIGFDDIMYSSLPRINLTTVYQPKYELGKVAAEILLGKIRSENAAEPKKICLESSLVIRNTCKTRSKEKE